MPRSRRFKNALIERALGSELTHHLGYPPGGTQPGDSTNYRNGSLCLPVKSVFVGEVCVCL